MDMDTIMTDGPDTVDQAERPQNPVEAVRTKREPRPAVSLAGVIIGPFNQPYLGLVYDEVDPDGRQTAAGPSDAAPESRPVSSDEPEVGSTPWRLLQLERLIQRIRESRARVVAAQAEPWNPRSGHGSALHWPAWLFGTDPFKNGFFGFLHGIGHGLYESRGRRPTMAQLGRRNTSQARSQSQHREGVRARSGYKTRSRQLQRRMEENRRQLLGHQADLMAVSDWIAKGKPAEVPAEFGRFRARGLYLVGQLHLLAEAIVQKEVHNLQKRKPAILGASLWSMDKRFSHLDLPEAVQLTMSMVNADTWADFAADSAGDQTREHIRKMSTTFTDLAEQTANLTCEDLEAGSAFADAAGDNNDGQSEDFFDTSGSTRTEHVDLHRFEGLQIRYETPGPEDQSPFRR